MRRDQLEHLIRAAGEVLGEDTVIVIGSQAILASVPAPSDQLLTRSMEADLLPVEDPDDHKADLIDGALGVGSMFDETHGIHADGVGLDTLVAPEGWRDRLIEICNDNTNGVRGLCLEPHDLVISKVVAGREKDLEFCAAAVSHGIVSLEVLRERLGSTSIDDARRSMSESRLRALDRAQEL